MEEARRVKRSGQAGMVVACVVVVVLGVTAGLLTSEAQEC